MVLSCSSVSKSSARKLIILLTFIWNGSNFAWPHELAHWLQHIINCWTLPPCNGYKSDSIDWIDWNFFHFKTFPETFHAADIYDFSLLEDASDFVDSQLGFLFRSVVMGFALTSPTVGSIKVIFHVGVTMIN